MSKMCPMLASKLTIMEGISSRGVSRLFLTPSLYDPEPLYNRQTLHLAMATTLAVPESVSTTVRVLPQASGPQR
jgi:hypothetical protein